MAAEHVERIGTRIRERRNELGLSRDEVARQMPGKVTGNAVYRWEKGLHEPRPEALESLAMVLGVPVAHFYVDKLADKTGSTPDLIGRLNGASRTQLDRIEWKLDALLLHFEITAAEIELERQRAATEDEEPGSQAA